MKGFEFKGSNNFNEHQYIAMKNTKHCANWIIGELYNGVQDGCEMPKITAEGIENDIYFSAMRDWYGVGCVKYDKAPREMRFAGEQFVRAFIHYLVSNDEDVEEIVEYSNK